MDISGTGLVTTSIIHESFTTMVADYNENMSYYNRNMRDILRIYERTVNDNIARVNIIGNTYLSTNHSTVSDISGNIYISRENSSIPTINTTNSINTNPNSRQQPRNIPINRNIIQNPYQRNNFFNATINRPFNPFGGINNLDIIRNDFNYVYENVIVRPTNEQIDRATDIIRWSPNMSQTTCPISLEPFQYNQNVCIIRHCGHLYNYDPLMHWFETNVRCPVCRFDIRDYIPINSAENIQTNNTDNNNQNNNNQNNNTDNNNQNNSITQDNSSNIVPYEHSENEDSEDEDSMPDLIEDEESIEQIAMDIDVDDHDTIIREYILSESNRINNQPDNSTYNNHRNLLRNNITSIFSSFLNNQFDQNMPLVTTSVNDFFYTLNIPLELDISYVNTRSSTRNIG